MGVADQPLGYEASGKIALVSTGRGGTGGQIPSGFFGKKYFGVTTIYKEGTPSVHRGWRRPPPGGRASPTAWGLQQLVMENHSAIRGLKISHRGACALPVDCVARVQEGRGRPCPRGQHVGRAVEEREFCPVNLDPNDCDPPLLLPIRRQTTSAWACVAPIARAEVCKT